MKENILNRSVNDIRLRSFQKQLNKTDSLLFNRDNSIIHIKKTNNVSLFNNNDLGVGFSCNKFGNLDTYSDRGTSISIDINAVKSSNKEIKKVCNNVYEDITNIPYWNNQRHLCGIRFSNIDNISNMKKHINLSDLGSPTSTVNNPSFISGTPSTSSFENTNFTNFNTSQINADCFAGFTNKSGIREFLYNKNYDHYYNTVRVLNGNWMRRCFPYMFIDAQNTSNENRLQLNLTRKSSGERFFNNTIISSNIGGIVSNTNDCQFGRFSNSDGYDFHIQNAGERAYTLLQFHTNEADELPYEDPNTDGKFEVSENQMNTPINEVKKYDTIYHEHIVRRLVPWISPLPNQYGPNYYSRYSYPALSYETTKCTKYINKYSLKKSSTSSQGIYTNKKFISTLLTDWILLTADKRYYYSSDSEVDSTHFYIKGYKENKQTRRLYDGGPYFLLGAWDNNAGKYIEIKNMNTPNGWKDPNYDPDGPDRNEYILLYDDHWHFYNEKWRKDLHVRDRYSFSFPFGLYSRSTVNKTKPAYFEGVIKKYNAFNFYDISQKPSESIADTYRFNLDVC